MPPLIICRTCRCYARLLRHSFIFCRLFSFSFHASSLISPFSARHFRSLLLLSQAFQLHILISFVSFLKGLYALYYCYLLIYIIIYCCIFFFFSCFSCCHGCWFTSFIAMPAWHLGFRRFWLCHYATVCIDAFYCISLSFDFLHASIFAISASMPSFIFSACFISL